MKLKKIIFLIIALLLVILGILAKRYYLKDEKNEIDINSVIVEEELKTENDTVATELERLNIKNYLESIYGDYVTIPEFIDVNSADEKWLWENVRSNIVTPEKTSYTYKELSDKTKELYGIGLTKTFPKEGSEFMVYNEKTDSYIAGEFSLELREWFVLSQIKKSGNLYHVEIIEYTEDLKAGETENPTSKMNLLNLEEDIIKTYDVSDNDENKEDLELEVQEYVLRNEKKFSKRDIILQLDEKTDLLYIKSCVSK